MSNAELSKKIYDYLSDGYDDEEYREETEDALCCELSQICSDGYIRTALFKVM